MFTLRDDETDARMAAINTRYDARRYDPLISHFVRVRDLDGTFRSVKLPNREAVVAFLDGLKDERRRARAASEANHAKMQEWFAAERARVTA